MASMKQRLYAAPRTRAQLPHPELPPGHELNKLQPVLSVRVDPKVKEDFERWVGKHGFSKRQAVEYALGLAMERKAPTPR